MVMFYFNMGGIGSTNKLVYVGTETGLAFRTANIVYKVNCRFSAFTILKCQRAKQ